MSEADLRDGLRAAVGDEPPLHFDPDELIRRAQHVRERRRALVAVAVATLGLTGTVLSLPWVLDQRPGIEVAGGGHVLTTTASAARSSSAAQSPSAPPPPSSSEAVPPPATTATAKPSSPDDTSSSFTAQLGERFVEVAPEAKLVSAEFTDTRGQEVPGYLTGVVRFVDRFGSSQVIVRVSAPPMRTTREQLCAAAECRGLERQEDGSHIEFAVGGVPGSKTPVHSVSHFRVDGSVVQVSAHGYDPGESGVVRAEVALTTDQLVRLATDARLTAH